MHWTQYTSSGIHTTRAVYVRFARRSIGKVGFSMQLSCYDPANICALILSLTAYSFHAFFALELLFEKRLWGGGGGGGNEPKAAAVLSP